MPCFKSKVKSQKSKVLNFLVDDGGQDAHPTRVLQLPITIF